MGCGQLIVFTAFVWNIKGTILKNSNIFTASNNEFRDYESWLILTDQMVCSSYGFTIELHILYGLHEYQYFDTKYESTKLHFVIYIHII